MRAFAVVLLLVGSVSVAAQQPDSPAPPDDELTIQAFLRALEGAISTSDQAALLALVSANADRAAATEFFASIIPDEVTRAVVRLRDRSDLQGSLPGEGYRLLTEWFIESGPRGRILTCTLDVRRPRDSDDAQPWRLIAYERLSFVDGLHRLTLDRSKQYAAKDLVITSVDLELRLPRGDVFVAETADGITTLVLLGDGSMVFTPEPQEERGQLKIFSGSEALDTPFSSAFVRVNPFDFQEQLKRLSLTPVEVDQRALRRAQEVFDEDISKSFSLDLSDLSRDTWSLLPQPGDFIAEVRTDRFGLITYARSTNEPEDISLFHRGRKKNIASYASPTKLASRGRFYNEDDLAEYDIYHVDVDAAFSPDREWLEGRARLRLRVKTWALAALTFKLNEQLAVRSVTSTEFGRLLFLRVKNQNAIVVNLPATLTQDYDLTLEVHYSGRMQTQSIDQESIARQEGQRIQEEVPYMPPESNWLFSNRSYWYPQGSVSDYATSIVRFTVPESYAVVASGKPMAGSPRHAPGPSPSLTYTFIANQPARYLGVVISKLHSVRESTITIDSAGDSSDSDGDGEEYVYLGGGILAPAPPGSRPLPDVGERTSMKLWVKANRRQLSKARDAVDLASDIVRFYSSIIGDIPYDSMTLALVESTLPGGHSPPYVVMLNNPPPMSAYTWRNDPAAFSGFPEFYLAHEIAHQWWGQAVGWRNYHEQWLSEGFAQYFAALFARERRGESAFREVLRQFRRWSLAESDQGPIYLGYRLGHLKNDSRVFRAVVYNKGAAVLHMLRRLVGDEAFFDGLRRFYAENRFDKAGTAGLQEAMEAASGEPLERFFQRWVYESDIPRVRYSTSIEGQELVVRFEQVGLAGEDALYDIPVTVTVEYADLAVDEIVRIREAVVERRLPLRGPARNVNINADDAAVAIFERR